MRKAIPVALMMIASLLLLTAEDCNDNARLTRINPPVRVVHAAIADPAGTIKNGSVASYTLSATVERLDGKSDELHLPVEIRDSTDRGPLTSNTVLDRFELTIPANESTGTAAFILSCAPAGAVGTLRGDQADSGHGARTCAGGNSISACVNDPVTVGVNVNADDGGRTGFSVLCMPSSGPTSGTTLPAPPAPKLPFG